MFQKLTATLATGVLTISVLAASVPDAGAQARSTACSILTKDLVSQFSSDEGRRALAMSARPIEEPYGPGVNACQIGRTVLILDPFKNAAASRTSMATTATAVPSVGDAALFKGDSAFANLYVWKGSRAFHVQTSVGPNESADSLRDHAVGLANAVLGKLN